MTGSGGSKGEIVSPIDGEVAYTFDRLGMDEALSRLSTAVAVQREWRRTPLQTRIELCRKMLDCYRERLQENAEQITRMMGKPVAHARGEFNGGTSERTRHLCDIAEQALADEVLPEKAGFRRYIRHEPVGVVLDIAAWNYPLLIAVNVIVPAVLAGNAVLVKHASQTALVADQFVRAFADAGAPEGLVQAFPVDHETAAKVIATRRFGYVSFTGSVRGGHEIARSVAQDNFINVGLELGGKDPALVLPDANFDFTVENLVDGAFFNAGQSCCGIERIYVHRDVYDRFVEAYAAKVREYKVGNPLDEGTTLGPVVDAAAAAHVKRQVAAAIAAGARSLVPASAFEVPDLSPCYLAPQVLDRVDHSMELMVEETFGPAVGIMRIDDVEQAVALMNDSPYGLTASIWTTDIDRGEAIARDVEAGTVYLNRCDYLDPALAWTGVKDSGVGCSLSRFGFLQVTRPKSYHLRTEIK
jgi:acyl-CoA reductase-like NAD-dependent aldehyde dehydrogenase